MGQVLVLFDIEGLEGTFLPYVEVWLRSVREMGLIGEELVGEWIVRRLHEG